MNTLDARQAAELIDTLCAAHGALALKAPEAAPVRAGSVQEVVQQACRRLGFIEDDAKCIAAAWQHQSQRTGHFDPLAWPAEPQDFGMAPWPRAQAFAPCPRALGLYAVMPDAHWVGRMARAGVPTVQLRLKSDDGQAIMREVRAAVEAVRGTDCLLFINDHWEAAIEAGAYGVHLGQEDMGTLRPAELARLRQAGLRLGLSTHGYAEMMRADRLSPSYLALGAVFPTTLKRMATAAQGVARLQRYARLMQAYPLVAIGGIDQQNLPAVMSPVIGSAAMVRALMTAPDPQATATQLAREVRTLHQAAIDTAQPPA